ncbi:unnamed protein product [Discosporangium mesarthrocarpum]
MGDEDGEAAADARIDYISARIQSTFPKLTGPKFTKAFQTDDNQQKLLEFLDIDEKTFLYCPETLKCDTAMPKKVPKSKTLVFVKVLRGPVTVEGISREIMVMEMGGNTPFEHLELLAHEIFLPILSNTQNQARWGEVPTREIMDRFYGFMSSTTILCGQIKGETRLPMPPMDIGGASNGKNRISLLEGAIITWTKQIKSVLKQDPESQLKQGMHPTPDVEIDFWKNKANNLNSIFEQLQGPSIRRVLRALDQSKSTYCTTFARLCKEVFTARLEANDNMKYLRTLEDWFDKLNTGDDFPNLFELFKPMLHIILLIWKNSKHYNTPARLVVLMREICNSLIIQACKYSSGEQIFALIEQEEAGKAVEQLKTTLLVCGTFKSTYFDYKATANAECPANPWRIQNNALFMRLDSFLERCHDILDLTQTIVQFSKLAKIEVGGTKGNTLTASIHCDFEVAVEKFKGVPYDILDVAAKQFDDDFYEFRCSIKELERRLGAVVSLAFDDCATVYGRFKLLDSFEGLLERPIIQDELEKKYVGLVQSYGADLKTVQELFLQSRDSPPISWNLPPIAGALTWCRGLVERIQIPMAKLQQLDRTILDREEAKEVAKVYATIMASLQEYENQKIEEWGRDVEASSQAKLKLPLLIRDLDKSLLSVNFDPALVKLLREVKYFLLLGLTVPDSALEIYKQVEVFRRWTGNLDLIVNMNNDVLLQLLPVEKPLVRPYLDKFDRMVNAGLSQLNWKSSGINEFIEESMEQVTAVHEVMRTMKTNLANVKNVLRVWERPLMERKPKPVDRDEFERAHKAIKTSRYAEIKEGGKEIHNMLKENNKVLKCSNASPDWRSYVDFVNNVVVDGLSRVICASLEYLLDQVDPDVIAKKGLLPMIEIKLDLVGDEVCFQPQVEFAANGKGIRDLVHSWVGSFFNIATLFKRLDNEGNYVREMQGDNEVQMLVAILNDTLAENNEACKRLKAQYEAYSYLWLTDMDSFFKEFTEDAVITTELGQQLTDLKKFEEAIKKYEGVQIALKKLSSPQDIGWLRVKVTPVKQALVTWSTKWVNMFTAYLQTTLVNKLGALDTFMADVSSGLDAEVSEGADGKANLMKVMKDISEVRKAMDTTQEMFDPLHQMVVLLKQHGIDVSGVQVAEKDVQDYLEEAPMSWDALVKKTFRKKEEILPMQMAEVDALKEELEGFFLAMREFRNQFRANAPFAFQGPVEEAYAKMEEHAAKLMEKEAQVRKYNELEDLFELQVSKYPETQDTRTELRLLKGLWDFKAIVDSSYVDWRTALWSEIDTEALDDANKNILKQLRKQGNDFPVVKGWQVYRDIEDAIKNMGVVLPLINDLHSDAMRVRHWKSLAKVCEVKSVDPSDAKFTMDDMMELKLHIHVEDVSEIVETAQKELKIENKLEVIEAAWKDMVLDYVPHKDTEMFVVKPSEELIESLEAHQMELQSMVGMGKFVDFFRDRVNHWQKTLGSVEEVLKLWTNVSRAWASLESIFLASADIRSQLPDDTKRFEGIDSEFKELMKEAINVPNAVDACGVDGRAEGLKSMMQRLEMCQKSLNEYLDMKKKIFPRFYFVSNVALLDMLANGTNPPKIMPYLGDCYDSLANLTFVSMEDGSTSTKTVNEMIAKDKEHLKTHEEFTMEGEVEGYLNRLTDMMVMTLKLRLNDGIDTAVNWEVEKPRHKWLFDYPAQVVLTGTQIYWTEETEAALEEFEGGQEDSVKRYLGVCNGRLSNLIDLVLGELTREDRTKIISLITLDVHARDVVQKLINEKTEGPAAFLWQQQLRFYWVQNTMDVDIRITDFRCKYFYEWIGNTGRLVITPLTDRCYITLTMGLRLFLGGAPAGPAGTGKTETTKDLARALALPCYVFNCSDQMNYQTMADIFRGLAQTGAWGCFDEFNRIPIEVLSVVATQVKTVQDNIVKYSVPANRDPEYQHLPAGTPPVKVGVFDFMGDIISLIPTCGFYITMNPGYAGRTELPENLKALFRSCAMIRPDLKPICENMLMSEGFQKARTLAIKFVTLYELSSDLLSKQFHYDWGLRAVKSVLRVAGMLKRGEPLLDEAQILMRALRDFNTPKIPAHDTPIFLRLIADLFMGLEVPSKVDEALKTKVIEVAKEMGLQYDDVFVLKTVQFQELLDVRHSVMLLGPAGSGKTTIWKALAATHNMNKPKKTCVAETVNPKAVTGDELYGYMTLSKDWKDGVLSIIMRGMSKNFSEQGFYEYQTYKWVVLDGDIDAVWIESMNTVMDDNKVLTLVSNERVPLSDAMRMVFEINSLKNATPATVSRAGILFINETDIGWKPFVESWALAREDLNERQALPPLFEKYIEATSTVVRKGFKEVTPLRVLNKVCTIVYLLEGLLESVPPEKKTNDVMEQFFVFALTWAFGGPMVVDKSDDYRRKFSEEFMSTFAGQKIPKEGTCFDYFYDWQGDQFVEWSAKVPEYQPIPIGGGPGETPFNQLAVATTDTVRMTFIMNQLVHKGKFMMLVGTAGTGKTSIVKEFLRSLDKDADGLLSVNINMNYFTDSAALQQELELNIDKRSGRRFGPPATKRLVCFLDDMNLPYVETYGTQNSIALLTQLVGYGTIFDRADLGFRKEIVDVQFLSAMNPTAGSFEICERLQRHFATFSCQMPSVSDLKLIYSSIFSGHMLGWPDSVSSTCHRIVDASISLHQQVAQKFLPSAVKFTYNWNMRELTNVFQGMCQATSDSYGAPKDIARLWLHECERVFHDRIITESEMEAMDTMVAEVAKKHLTEFQADMFQRPVIFTNFCGKGASTSYVSAPDIGRLKAVLDGKLQEYNESNAMMDLVLFEQAMEHLTRICRIIQRPSGNAMLIGVGGSGKQSLSRLAAFICGYEVRQLSVTSNFKVEDLKEALQEMFRTAGVKGVPLLFLMTDGQIVNDRFLIYINSILANGWISDLFAKDEIDGLTGGIRNEAKAASIPDTPEAMLDFLILRIRTNLHVVLCFSPVGDIFRIRARRFPGLINCTSVDFFHPWPRQALISVAARFLEDVDLGDDSVKDNLAIHMAEEHLSVTRSSTAYFETQRRYNYVTPKSYLELIGFYKFLLDQKRSEVQRQIDRLDVGLSTLRKTAADVAELQVDLKHTMVKVEEKKAATGVLLEEMGVQRAGAEKQQAAANVEAEKAAAASAEAAEIEKNAEAELSQAEPAMKAAANAVDCLSKNMLTELKSLPKPPAGVDKVVTKAVLILVEKEYKNHAWDRAKKMMNNVDQFKNNLVAFRGEDITEDEIKKVETIVNEDGFSVDNMKSKSAAAANLCMWVISIYTYNRIYVKVKPLMDSLEGARKAKADADASLKLSNDMVAAVEAKLAQLQDKFMEATEEKAKVEAEASACLTRLSLAERLVGGLSSENERWGSEIEKLRENALTLVGDCMLASGFVSYVGAFDQGNRDHLWKGIWTPDIEERKIPLTPGVDPLDLLTNDGNNAKMISEGLPADRISLENGSIITNCKRWPLIIDPQQQGIKWLRKREEDNGLAVIQLSQKKWLRSVEGAINSGQTLIIENISEDIDATLDPVLARAIYKKGRSLFLKLGGEEVEYDPGFQLYLQTKLSNPHYKPEIAAQCTLINFIATEKGLEDQLLAKVVGVERPELEKQAQELQSAFQQYKIQLVQLEDDLLERLANAPDDILSDVPLIEGLEATKAAAKEIAAAVEKGKQTEKEINVARELYRKQATEGAMLYFLLTKLCLIDHMYQYSLDSFVTFFVKSVSKAKSAETIEQRVLNLRGALRMTIYTWVSRGLFERHKLIFLSQLAFNLMKRGILGEENLLNEVHFQFLLRGPRKQVEEYPLPWLPDPAWQACNALGELEEFSKFSSDLVEAAPRFREWFNHITPENEKLPLDWSSLDRTPFQKMLVVRCLRPDRMNTSLSNFIRVALPDGSAYADCDSTLNSFQILEESFLDSTTTTPIYFILSPGANVVGDLDKLADKYSFVRNESYHNVSMGQGQDVVAMSCLELAHRNGHWVILNNIHLMPRWLIELEKKLDEFALEGSHEKFRLYLSSDPSNAIPIGVLSRCIKLTNEPPAGLKANLKRAFANFNREYIEEADSKTKSILFGLCHFHAIMMERKLYGPMGFNMMYPFSIGDLRDSAVCLSNYMENSGGGKIPWQDLKYIFGEIMYGGHIVNDFDRLLANEYLDWYMKDELLDETELYPFAEDEKGTSFLSPPPTSYDKYLEHIDTTMGADTPIAFGLHPNAEIDFRTQQSDNMFKTLMELQPRDASLGEGVQSPEQMVGAMSEGILDKFGEKKFDVEDIVRSLEEAGPYQNVFMQEMDVMNTLLTEIVRSLKELQLGFAGELTMSDAMEGLMSSLYLDKVPATWSKRAWPSLRPLASWLANFSLRLHQLDEWQNNPMEIPKVTWISGLVNPQSFLTAICQVTAQKNQWELDKLQTQSEMLKKVAVDEVDSHSKEGAYIIGLSMQGARWDMNANSIEKSKPKEMFCTMPIMCVKGISVDRCETQGLYQCPVYKTEQRGPTFVFCAQLKTKSPQGRWVLAGVSLIMDVA